MTSRSRLFTGLLWTAPWWLGFLLFLAIPMGASLYISFCDYPLLQPPAWVGTTNYTSLASDEVFHKVIWNTTLYALISIPIGTIIAILLATMLNARVRGQGVYRACIFIPTIVPMVAAGIVWLWMLNPEYGLINQGLHHASFALKNVVTTVSDPLSKWVSRLDEGPRWLSMPCWAVTSLTLQPSLWVSQLGDAPRWLSTPYWAMTALILVSIWTIGSPVVIYLAGLQEIPEELYEAALLDGANTYRQFWHVTLPGLSPVILFNVIIAIIGTWQIFALPYVLMRGEPGPERSTYFYTMYLYDNAFRYLKMGYASAMAWIQLFIILALTGLVFLASRRSVHYRGA